MIDVSLPPLSADPEEAPEAPEEPPSDLYPVATLRERRCAALIDAACLAFAYGGFLALFGSLGGQFTLSKLSAVVCFFDPCLRLRAILRPLHYIWRNYPGHDGPRPASCKFYWRSSHGQTTLLAHCGLHDFRGNIFPGIFLGLWDEDAMTWHDRLSRTYLAVPQTSPTRRFPMRRQFSKSEI